MPDGGEAEVLTGPFRSGEGPENALDDRGAHAQSGVLAAEFDRGRRGGFCTGGSRRGAPGQGCRLDADTRVPEAGGPGGEFFRERVVRVEQEVEPHVLQVAAGEGECGQIGGERGVEREAPVEGVAEQFKISLDDRGQREEGGAPAGPPARGEEPGGRSAERRALSVIIWRPSESVGSFFQSDSSQSASVVPGGGGFRVLVEEAVPETLAFGVEPEFGEGEPGGRRTGEVEELQGDGIEGDIAPTPVAKFDDPDGKRDVVVNGRRRRSELSSACTALRYGVMFWTVPKRPSIFPSVARVARLRTWRIVRRPGWGAIAVSSSLVGPSSRARRAADAPTRRSGGGTRPSHSSRLGVPKAGSRSWMRQASSDQMSSPVEKMHRPWPTRVNCGASATISLLSTSFPA